MKTRDRNKSVVHELLKKHQQPSQREAQAPSPSDSCRKRKAGENVAGSLALQQGIFGPEVVGRKIAVYWRKPGEWFKAMQCPDDSAKPDCRSGVDPGG